MASDEFIAFKRFRAVVRLHPEDYLLHDEPIEAEGMSYADGYLKNLETDFR